ncbi:MAG TPA: hypothetical protein VMW65_12730 [Chloroflexota bacterium]|nr:hypothetical protein [Chloroflexota bacterium]
MRRVLGSLFLILGVLATSCAPASTSTEGKTANAVGQPAATPGSRATPLETPVPFSIQQIHSDISNAQSDMQQVRQNVAQMPTEQRQCIQTQVGALLGTTGQTAADLQPAVNKLTPQQKQRVVAAFQQMQTTVAAMQQQGGLATPIATRAAGQTPDATQIRQQLVLLKQQLQGRSQLDAAQLQQVMDNVNTLLGQADNLVVQVEVVLPELTAAQKQTLMQSAQQLQATARQIKSTTATSPCGATMVSTPAPTP